jgi:DNA (cytosine-5)-methyltransferase 1
MAQIPVVGWLRRHITPKECARIQDFDVDGIHGNPFKLGDSDQQSYKQLGNAVNVNMIQLIQERIDLYLAGKDDQLTVSIQPTLLNYI